CFARLRERDLSAPLLRRALWRRCAGPSRGYRYLKNRGQLSSLQVCQQRDLAVGEFECIVMGPPLVQIDLTEDRGFMVDNWLRPYAHNFACERQLCPRK